MNRTLFCFQSAFFLATTITTSIVVSTPSQAFELTFSDTNVLSGIKGVPFTLPSTGKTKTYNITLEKGNIFDVYGNPPIFDVFTEIDAKVAMEESAKGINFYLANVSQDISFGYLGTNIFYIPYAFDSSTQVASYWSSGKKFNDDGTPFVSTVQVNFAADIPVVYANLQEVPEPFTVFGLFTTLGFGYMLKRK